MSLKPMLSLFFLAFFVACCKDAGQDTPSECEGKNKTCTEDSTPPQAAPTPISTPTPLPTPTPLEVQEIDLQNKNVGMTFNIGFSHNVDKIEVHDQYNKALKAIIAIWPHEEKQNIYDLSKILPTSDLFFLAGAETKNINAIVGFKNNHKVFSAQVKVIANADTEITMLAHLFSESGAGIGPYSTRFAFSKHPEKKRTNAPKLDKDKPIEFIAIDDKGNILWLVNTKDEQTRIATGAVMINNGVYAWYRPIHKDCQLQQLVFARLENKIFQATCEDQLKK